MLASCLSHTNTSPVKCVPPVSTLLHQPAIKSLDRHYSPQFLSQYHLVSVFHLPQTRSFATTVLLRKMVWCSSCLQNTPLTNPFLSAHSVPTLNHENFHHTKVTHVMLGSESDDVVPVYPKVEIITPFRTVRLLTRLYSGIQQGPQYIIHGGTKSQLLDSIFEGRTRVPGLYPEDSFRRSLFEGNILNRHQIGRNNTSEL